MLRRALSVNTARTLASRPTISRCYTNYQHIKYPIHWKACAWLIGYFTVLWLGYVRVGSIYTYRSKSYKYDYLNIWERKLGKGYQWADAWGPEMTTIFKNLPVAVE